MTVHTTRIDPRRRTGVLPGDVLAQAHITPEDDLIVSSDGDGRIVLETRAALIARIKGEHGDVPGRPTLAQTHAQVRADEVAAEERG